jgi:pimeloyl-ACP methyl ester carboxylesterase
MPPIVERRSTYAGFQTRELVVTGRGPTVLLLHGFGDSADTWRPVLTLLAEAGQAAIAVDLPGFGKTLGAWGFEADEIARLQECEAVS